MVEPEGPCWISEATRTQALASVRTPTLPLQHTHIRTRTHEIIQRNV